jgi:hypothetical protein
LIKCYFIFIIWFILVFILLISFIKKRFNILLFLLTIELAIIIFAFIRSFIIIFNFLIILIIGVLEAILGLTLLIRFIRFFGNDQVYLF